MSTSVRRTYAQLRFIYTWITEKIVLLSDETSCFYRNLTSELIDNKVSKPKVMTYLSKLDVRLKDIIVKKRSKKDEVQRNGFEYSGARLAHKRHSDNSNFDIFFERESMSGEQILMPFEEESSGTVVLYDGAGLILQATEKGYTVFIDELNCYLHPHVFKEIVSLFNDSKDRCGHSQLIFTTHDVTVSNSEVIERDQVWLIDRSHWHSSSLYAFSEFQDKKETPFADVYLNGMVGAVPIIS